MTSKVNRVALGQNVAVLFCPSPTGKVFGVTIDKEDLPRVLAGGFWKVRKDQGNFYAYRQQQPRWLHQFVAGYKSPDHRNRRGLDNRKSNLRPATVSQNAANRRPSRQGFKGIAWHKQAGKYTASLKHNSKVYYLGLFSSPEDAARAYDKKALEIHGEYAYLNFPEVKA